MTIRKIMYYSDVKQYTRDYDRTTKYHKKIVKNA